MNDDYIANVHARLGILITSSINAAGMILQLILQRSIPQVPIWPVIVSMAVGAGIFIYLFLFKKKASNHLYKTLYIINSASVIITLFIIDPYILAAKDNWVPFQANKLGCFIAALTAPSILVGLITILGYAGSSVVQFFLFAESIRQGLTFGEPFAIVGFGLAGILTLIYRMKRIETEKELYYAHAEAVTYKNLAAMSIELRDLMNTPLQIIEISIGVLGNKKTDATAPVLEKLEHACRDLRKINTVLSRYDESMDWQYQEKFLNITD